MEFPEEIVRHINGYAKPITRCDWRTCGRIRYSILLTDFLDLYDKHSRVVMYFSMADEEKYINYKNIITYYDIKYK